MTLGEREGGVGVGVAGGKREEGVGDKYDGVEERVLTSYGSNLMVGFYTFLGGGFFFF